jgi:hypothetical protein
MGLMAHVQVGCQSVVSQLVSHTVSFHSVVSQVGLLATVPDAAAQLAGSGLGHEPVVP